VERLVRSFDVAIALDSVCGWRAASIKTTFRKRDRLLSFAIVESEIVREDATPFSALGFLFWD